MNASVIENSDKILVKLEGDLDTAAAREAEKVFEPLLKAENKNIEIDCTALNYISSSGLRLFLSLLKSCKPNGNTLVLENVNDNIKKVFAMTGFSALFNMK